MRTLHKGLIKRGHHEIVDQRSHRRRCPQHFETLCTTCDLIGTFAFLLMHNIGHMGSASAIIEDVVVAQDHQGQGIGQQMMLQAMKLAKEMGCYKMVLSSNIKRTRAHDFYESLGFEKHGHSFRIDL